MSKHSRRGGWGAALRGLVFHALLLLIAVLIGMAIHYQLAGLVRLLGWAGLSAATLAAIWAYHARRRGFGWLALAAILLLAGGWWSTIRPLHDRDWAPDVAHGVTAEIDGSQVVLHNLRAFEWRSLEDFTETWESRRYDLDTLVSVDLITSVWSSPAIAHTLISFGFADGDYVTFSAEIRKERNEAFSELGGFFKQFELALIAADERDILYLRSNVRREDVSVFPLDVTPEQARALFLRYLELGNQLEEKPAFYHTILANCTTIIFALARLVEPGVPTDWRILLSGYLPDYLHDLGILAPDLGMAEIRQRAAISAIAQAAPADADYSVLIRQNWRQP